MAAEIIWPEGFEPGFTDNFCSNEMIVQGLSCAQIWPLLSHPAAWPTYYENCANPKFKTVNNGELTLGCDFSFETFGFLIDATVTEYVAPSSHAPARLAWHGWNGEKGTPQRLDVLHAWLIEDLSGGRVRILTQETQCGQPALALATTRPNPMINGHQQWLDGLIESAKK